MVVKQEARPGIPSSVWAGLSKGLVVFWHRESVQSEPSEMCPAGINGAELICGRIICGMVVSKSAQLSVGKEKGGKKRVSKCR